MQYDLSNDTHVYLFKKAINYLLDNKKLCELKETKKKRTLNQNKALHLYFEHISKQLNDIGHTFNYTGLKGINIEIPYSQSIVKDFIWRPIQITLFQKESTTELTTEEINTILDVLSKFFSEKGVYVPFPSVQSLIDYYNDQV